MIHHAWCQSPMYRIYTITLLVVLGHKTPAACNMFCPSTHNEALFVSSQMPCTVFPEKRCIAAYGVGLGLGKKWAKQKHGIRWNLTMLGYGVSKKLWHYGILWFYSTYWNCTRKDGRGSCGVREDIKHHLGSSGEMRCVCFPYVFHHQNLHTVDPRLFENLAGSLYQDIPDKTRETTNNINVWITEKPSSCLDHAGKQHLENHLIWWSASPLNDLRSSFFADSHR